MRASALGVDWQKSHPMSECDRREEGTNRKHERLSHMTHKVTAMSASTIKSANGDSVLIR